MKNAQTQETITNLQKERDTMFKTVWELHRKLGTEEYKGQYLQLEDMVLVGKLAEGIQGIVKAISILLELDAKK